MLALWEFFWDWDGTPAPAPAPAPTPSPTDAGGGHKKPRRYERLGDDFWEVRERYLRRFVEPVAKQVTPVPHETNATEQADAQAAALQQATMLRRQALDAALQRARNAQDAAELLDAALRARALALDILNLQQQYYTSAIALLLLDVF